jgi:hypothetical protein
MPQATEGLGSAGDAEVSSGRLGPAAAQVADYLRTLVDEAEEAVPLIEKTIEDLKTSLAAKKAEIKKFRADHAEMLRGDN